MHADRPEPASTARSVWADERWRGRHGIARYAGEVLARLSIPWVPLGAPGGVPSVRDVFRRPPREVRDGLVYSPGYNVRQAQPRQLVTVHDLIHLRLPVAQRARYLAYYNGPLRRAILRTGVVLTVSETSRAAIAEWLRDDSVEIVNAGNGCSDAFVRNDDPGGSPDYFLFVGNLRDHKNVNVLLHALALASTLRVRMVVPADEAARLERRARSVGVHDQIEIVSGLDDDALAIAYRGASATLMPSTLEGFGLPALESLMCGTPVIYWTGCEAVAEIVNGDGLAVDSARDPRQWADAMIALAGRALRVDTPRKEKYSWPRTSEIVSQTIGSVAGSA